MSPAATETAEPKQLYRWLWAGWAIVLLAGLALLYATVSNEWPAPIIAVMPVAAIVGLCLVAHTPTGLAFAAFAIAPLGIVRAELAGVTFSLPEILVWALFAKEALIFFARNERPAAVVPWGWLLLYLATAGIGVITGLLYGNGLIRVLQDCRQFVEYIVLYLLVVHRVQGRQQIKTILAAFVAGCVLVALHGILQHFTALGIPATQLASDMIFHGGIRSGSFYGATPLGAIMVLAIGASLGLMLSASRHTHQAVLAGAAGILVIAAVFTNTRASWMAIVLLLLVVLVSVRLSPLLIASLTMAAVLFAVALGPLVVERMGKLEISKTERSLYERVRYYTTAWHIFESHPFFGLGWGAYYDQSAILANHRYVPTDRPNLPAHMTAPEATVHSAYLQLLVKVGAAGLVSFLLVLWHWFGLFLRARRARPRVEADHNLFIGVSAAILGYLFHAAGENFFQWPVMSQIFWLFFGLSTVMAVRLARHGHVEPHPDAREL